MKEANMKQRPKLARQTAAEYVQSGGVHCPFCKSRNIDSDPLQTSDFGEATANVRCGDCHEEWVDTYHLCDVEQADELTGGN